MPIYGFVSDKQLIHDIVELHCLVALRLCTHDNTTRVPCIAIISIYRVLHRRNLRPSGWACFGQSLWPHQLFWLPHQRNKAVESMGATMLKGPRENTDKIIMRMCYLNTCSNLKYLVNGVKLNYDIKVSPLWDVVPATVTALTLKLYWVEGCKWVIST